MLIPPSPVPRDPEVILEALAARIARTSYLAALLDKLGRREQAAKARESVADPVHLLGLLRTDGGAAPEASATSRPC